MLTPKKTRPKTLTARITIKVPLEHKKDFQDEARARGLSESDYGRCLLFEASRKSEQRTLNTIGNIVGMIAQRIGISTAELTALVKGTNDR